MLKLYRAWADHDKIVLEDKVIFNDKRFGENDQIRTVKPNVSSANYEFRSLDKFRFFIN